MDRQNRLQPERESRTSSPECPPEGCAENTVGPAEVTIRGAPGDEKRHRASSSLAARGASGRSPHYP